MSGHPGDGFRARFMSKGEYRIDDNEDMCSWDEPVPVQVRSHHKMSQTFPYGHGTLYVRAFKPDREARRVILRMTLGGNGCSTILISAVKTAGTFCSCRAIPGAKRADCYIFTGANPDLSALNNFRKELCPVPFMCDETPGVATNLCIKRTRRKRFERSAR